MKDFSIIVAMDQARGIGRAGGLPWHLPADMKHFKKVTLSVCQGKMNAVLMGRKTWESIPERFRPLSGRLNVVLTRAKETVVPDGCLQFSDFAQALTMLSQDDQVDQIFVIGGAHVYGQAITLPQCRFLYVTEIQNVFDCDAFFPDISADFQKRSESHEWHENGYTFVFCKYEKKK